MTKTLTLAQAQQMGLIPGGGAKIITQVASGSSAQKQILLNKTPVSASKTVKLISSAATTVQSKPQPAKILPAPVVVSSAGVGGIKQIAMAGAHS